MFISESRTTTDIEGLTLHNDRLVGVITEAIDSQATTLNKAVIDRSLRPRCCHLGSYFKRPKSSPVRPLAATGITAHSL